jgi:hypothetical protein
LKRNEEKFLKETNRKEKSFINAKCMYFIFVVVPNLKSSLKHSEQRKREREGKKQ